MHSTNLGEKALTAKKGFYLALSKELGRYGVGMSFRFGMDILVFAFW